ncbi:undecaprenyl-diphosphatase [Aneurinibacillus terranovensis]|uniref:undecaprenyl-diphosphatase n=1 Tax=Aneurinibacillus terranovensis TaxID=278991 RepID=UPI00041E13E2|nr:undecaprenyl-diphosphatase [Aneurinibacillus terranovensis]
MSFSQFDYQIFQSINHLAVVFPALNPLMRFLSLDGEYLFYLGIIVYWFSRKHNRPMVIQSLLSACVALGISAVIGLLKYRDRPFISHHVIQLIPHAANASFPSDHATGAFVIATSIWLFRKREGRAWLVLAACVAFSRIWVGVHYPSDVIAGIILGTITALKINDWLPQWKMIGSILNSGLSFYEKIEQRIFPVQHKRNSR